MSAPTITVAQAVEALGLTTVVGGEGMDAEVAGAQVSDLLSYVMAGGKPGHLWITIQTHPNIVAVAALARLAGIIIASGFEPGDDTVGRAEEEGVPLFTSPLSAFALAGRLYQAGVR